MLAAAWVSGFGWQRWLEDSEALSSESQALQAEAGAVILVFNLRCPSLPDDQAAAEDALARAAAGKASEAAGLFAAELGPLFAAAVKATFPDVFPSIARAKVIEASLVLWLYCMLQCSKSASRLLFCAPFWPRNLRRSGLLKIWEWGGLLVWAAAMMRAILVSRRTLSKVAQ